MVRLIIDSPACASEEFVKVNNISVVNLNVMLDGESRKEGFEPTWADFFEKLKNTKDFPKTSLPSPEEFLKAFDEFDDSDEIIVVTLSKSLSGTYNAACLAKDMAKNPERIFVIDSGQCAQSELILVEEIVELIKQGKTGQEIFDISQELVTKLCIQFVPSTMEYLKRGGRISLLSATFASVLNIKPILAFKNGVLTCAKKCLGMGKALTEIVRAIPEKCKKIYVIYIHESEFISELIAKVNNHLKLNILEAKKIGPIIGSHIGIGAVGVATLAE